jgi:osmotically-inducible protein OsmY
MRSGCFVALAACCAALLACETPAGALIDSPLPAPPGPPPPSPPTEASFPDEQVAEAVRRSLVARLADPAADGLGVVVEQGVVTLMGVVPDLLTKDLLVQRSRAVRGVVGVIDLLEVRAEERPDEDVGRDVEAALAADALVPATVGAEVRRGTATLRGEVSTLEERLAAEDVARRIFGVLSVRNEVTVRPPEPVPDALLARDIELTFARDPWLVGHALTVLVDEGRVILAGQLGTPYEEQRALRLVQALVGVLDVQSVVTVPKLALSDAALRAAVIDALFWNPLVDPQQVVVDVQGGVVWLRGVVWDLDARAQARESAFLAGARTVRNELKVVTSPTDVRQHRVLDPSYQQRDPVFFDTPFNFEGGRPY